MEFNEVWKHIPKHKGYYISSDGNINRGNKSLKPSLNDKGYLVIKIGTKNYKMHRLVALVFLGIPLDDPRDVHHKDEDKTNNHHLNLKVETKKAHRQHHLRPNSKLTKNDVLAIAVRLKHGDNLAILAKDFNVDVENIRHINKGNSWKDITTKYGFKIPIQD